MEQIFIVYVYNLTCKVKSEVMAFRSSAQAERYAKRLQVESEFIDDFYFVLPLEMR